jgi:hypothetical protein
MGQVPLHRNGEYLGSVNSDFCTDHCKHVDLKAVGACSQGCCDIYECRQCGRRFQVEVPD